MVCFGIACDVFPIDVLGVCYKDAGFFANSKVHLLSKRRSDRATRLYRLDNIPENGETAELTLLAHWEIDELVTGSDFSPFGNQLAVVTYDSVWIVEFNPTSQNPLGAPQRFAPFKGPKQVEAVAWKDPQTLLITDEKSGRLYEVPTENLYTISMPNDR